MSDRFQPLAMGQLTQWVFKELEQRNALFGIPKELFFTPDLHDVFRTSVYDQTLETPFGVAAGPHTQLAPNILAAWLCGGRFIELKTIQTLDELEISKPCIDMPDEGYNVEWSQELRIPESLDEYVRAWVLIHALHHKLGFPGDRPGMIFNMSVGYNLEGILQDNVQHFLRTMQDASELVEKHTATVAEVYPPVRDLFIPARLSDNVTLSTMHGCPPEEIGKIAAYLIEEWGLHTSVKLNPTLLGPERLRGILNDTLGFRQVQVPDEAFGHDLKYPDAIELLEDLRGRAARKGVVFGVKLSNTLECVNHRDVFSPDNQMMYMSGRPLQAVTVNLARQLADEFAGELLMSYAGGADAFNVDDLLACGMSTITVCSDLLRTGGYMRLLQYVDHTATAIVAARATNLAAFIRARCGKTDCAGTADCARENLRDYAERVLSDPLWKKDTYEREHTKTERPLGLFDCIAAPCASVCPVNQKVPAYLEAVSRGDYATAIDLVRDDNPMPSVLGRACTHICEQVCVRTHLDEPLAIREIKRFIMDQEERPHYRAAGTANQMRVGIVGGGPCGLGAAYFLRQAGCEVVVFEERDYSGGMVQGTIPGYRATQAAIDQDMDVIRQLGVAIRYNQKAGRDFTLGDLRKEFSAVVLAAGAQQDMPMGVPGEEAAGVHDCLGFLRAARHGQAPALGQRVGVIGGGDVAMDCARTAKRLTGADVQVIYRRTRHEMPAEKEEVQGLLEEGITLLELTAPVEVLTAEGGRLQALRCIRMELGEPDESGRRRPVPVEGSEYDIPLDDLIVAIGQQPALEFVDEEGIIRNRKGYIEVDPSTMRTNVDNVYAGGDAALDGPSTIVKAFADGKTIARAILNQAGNRTGDADAAAGQPVDLVDLLRRRSHRQPRECVPHLPADQRGGFDEIIATLDETAAREESARCLACDRFCGLCATVCPNRAIQLYESDAIVREVPEIEILGTAHEIVASRLMRVEQSTQVMVQTDLCNECGNCRTFCPTVGSPYRDKPRFYLQHAEFAAEHDHAFMLVEEEGRLGIRGKFGGEVHELFPEQDALSYAAHRVRVSLDESSFAITDVALDNEPKGSLRLSLEPAFILYALWRNVPRSLPHLPVVPIL